MKCEHKEDKYGCVEGCKAYYPIIPRESIIAEMDYEPPQEECQKCKDFIDGLQTVIEGQQIMIKSLLTKGEE